MELDHLLGRLSEATRLLPVLTAPNAAEERRRLSRCVSRCERAEPRWWWVRRDLGRAPRVWLEGGRRRAADSPASALYLRRLDEIEHDLAILDALGDARRIPPLVARRFGTPSMSVTTERGPAPLGRVARRLLRTVPDTAEPQVLPADDPNPQTPSVARLMRSMARAAGLDVRVTVEPRLAAAAAAGNRTVLLADRCFGGREAVRLAVHEILGHLVSAANGRAQPLRIVELGTAGSFADQEGLCILLEESAGVLDGRRLRTLAARVVAAECMHEGATFHETARLLVDEHGFEPADAVTIGERAYRGGGVARDVSYLAGWLRVRAAVGASEATIADLQLGRVSLAELPTLRALQAGGLVRPPVYRPSLSRSLRSTHSGTSFQTSPPSDAASFTRFEAT